MRTSALAISVLTMAALNLTIAACSGPTSEKPVDKPSAENTPLPNADSEAAAAEVEAKSINQAAEKATALIEAESKAEIKAMGASGGDTKSE